MRIGLLLILALIGCSDSGNDAVRTFHVETPRSYGYVIGDEIPVRITLDTRPDVSLETGSLPAKGPINRWLNIKDVQVTQNGRHYRIDLRYQVFYAPLSVKSLTLPGFDLHFSLGELKSSQPVPAWQFTLSPLHEPAVLGQDDREPLRPDAPPPMLNSSTALMGLMTGLIISLLAAGYLAYLYGYWPEAWRQTVFKRALKQLKKVSAKEMEEALVILHHALNRLNNQPLYPDQLPSFYQKHPHYRPLHSQLQWFFNYSNHFFFSRHVSATELDLKKIISLCEHCRKIERGGL